MGKTAGTIVGMVFTCGAPCMALKALWRALGDSKGSGVASFKARGVASSEETSSSSQDIMAGGVVWPGLSNMELDSLDLLT